MAGLCKGVLKIPENTAFPFTYNNIDELNNITKNHDIMHEMEVSETLNQKII